MHSQRIGPTDTVMVSAAAGGVGALTAQLCVAAGARVVGTAGPANHDLLRSWGVVPVEYGAGLTSRIRAAAPDGVDVVLDTVGFGTVETALELGVPPDRVNTIADYPAREKYQVRGVGGAAAGVDELAIVADRIVRCRLEFPIDSMFSLDNVRDAYRRSIAGHVSGKIVVTVAPQTELNGRVPPGAR